MKLFLDDIRREPAGYVLVRSFEDCIFELGTKDYDTVSLDYALSERFTGLDCAEADNGYFIMAR